MTRPPLWARSLVALARRGTNSLSAEGRRRLGRLLGWGWYRLVPIRRRVAYQQVEERLALAPGEARNLVREMYLLLGERFVDLFGTEAPIETIGLEATQASLAPGSGAIVVTAHLGSYERLAGVRLGSRPIHIVSSRFRARWAQTLWEALRFGRVSVLEPTRALRSLKRLVLDGHVVVFMLDQHSPAHTAVPTTFLGRTAWTSATPARLALSTGAPLVPVVTWRADGVDRVEFGPVLRPRDDLPRAEAIEELTGRAVAILERAVRAHPSQWLWLHRRWKPAGSTTERFQERRRVRMAGREREHSTPGASGVVEPTEARGRDAQVEPGGHVVGRVEHV